MSVEVWGLLLPVFKDGNVILQPSWVGKIFWGGGGKYLFIIYLDFKKSSLKPYLDFPLLFLKYKLY